MERAALYCRLSKEDQDKEYRQESESIQNQKLMLVDYAISRGYSIYNIYIDDDYSGLDRERPEFNKMIKDAKMKKFDIIICKSQSRFTRDMELVERYIHGLFPLLGIGFISIIDNGDTRVSGNKKIRQINGLINEWYSEDLSENIRKVLRKKMESGQFIGSFACFGYKKDPKDRHKLVVDEEAAQVVRRIFNLYLSGYSISEIGEILTGEKILTPTFYKQSKGLAYRNTRASSGVIESGIWSSSTIKRILENRTYTGCLIQGREKKLSYKSKKMVITPKKEWVILDNNHEPIISKDMYLQVENLRKKRRKVRL
ncbi:MAG: recombinase family protein [Clostridiales bacterium]|nr:recombinase family protein [Clostridiales bacterium]